MHCPLNLIELSKSSLWLLPSSFHVSGLPAIPLLWSHKFSFLQACCFQHQDMFLCEGLCLVPCLLQEHDWYSCHQWSQKLPHSQVCRVELAPVRMSGMTGMCPGPAWWELRCIEGVLLYLNPNSSHSFPTSTGLLTLNPAEVFGRTWSTQPLWAVPSAQQQVRMLLGQDRIRPREGSQGQTQPLDGMGQVWTCRKSEGGAVRKLGWNAAGNSSQDGSTNCYCVPGTSGSIVERGCDPCPWLRQTGSKQQIHRTQSCSWATHIPLHPAPTGFFCHSHILEKDCMPNIKDNILYRNFWASEK